MAKTVNNSTPERVVPTRMRITASTTTPVTYTYTRVPTNRAHYFRDEMYLLPIPDIKIRRVPQFRQNPGWYAWLSPRFLPITPLPSGLSFL